MRIARAAFGIVAGSALIIGIAVPTASAQILPIDLPVDVPVDLPIDDLPVDLPIDDLPVDLPGLDLLDLDLLGLLAPILECAAAPEGLPDDVDLDAGILLCVIAVAVDLLGALLGDLPVPDVAP